LAKKNKGEGKYCFIFFLEGKVLGLEKIRDGLKKGVVSFKYP